MQAMQIISTLSLLLLILTQPLWAQSLETRKMRAEHEAALGTQVALTNKRPTARVSTGTRSTSGGLDQTRCHGAAALDAVEDPWRRARQGPHDEGQGDHLRRAATPSADLKDGELIFIQPHAKPE